MLPILLAIAFIVLLFIIVIAGQPNEFSVTRWTKIAAPTGQVFPYINELRKWEEWNPWGKLDPNCKMTYDGPSAGEGSTYAWSGNNKVGSGRCTITESVPDKHVHLRLEFFKPMTATNSAVFTFEPKSGETLVTWTMLGKNSLGAKIFGLFMNCEKMCAKQFDKGLAQMKSVIETTGKTVPRT